MKHAASIMTEYPERRLLYKSISYSLFGFLLLPYLLSLLNADQRMEYTDLVWVDIAYHTLNFGAAAILFAGYLKDAFFQVQIYTKKVLTHALVGTILMVVWACVMGFVGVFQGNSLIAFGVLPITEIEMMGTAGAMLGYSPAFGAVVNVFLAPFTISCLLYATVFSTVSGHRPWLAYVAIAVVLAVPRAFAGITFWDKMEMATLYAVQLPIHLIACRIYQKTDTIWTPIFALFGANAVVCALTLL